MAMSLVISKKRSTSALKTLSFGEKIAKIGPADHEIIILSPRSIKDVEEKKINASKIYSPSGMFAERAK